MYVALHLVPAEIDSRGRSPLFRVARRRNYVYLTFTYIVSDDLLSPKPRLKFISPGRVYALVAHRGKQKVISLRCLKQQAGGSFVLSLSK